MKNTRDLDSWYGYLHERNALIDYVRTHRISGVVFLSADMHFSGVWELYGGTLEP